LNKKIAAFKAEKDPEKQESLMVEISEILGSPLYESALFFQMLNKDVLLALLQVLELIPSAKNTLAIKSKSGGPAIPLSSFITEQTDNLVKFTKMNMSMNANLKKVIADLQAELNELKRAAKSANVEIPAVDAPLPAKDFDLNSPN